MADAYGSYVQHWRCHIRYGIESQTETQAVVYCTTYFNTNAWGYNVKGTDKATVNGQTSSVNTDHVSDTGQTVDTAKVTKKMTITKNNSVQKIPVSGSVQLTGGYHNGTSSASGTVEVGERAYHAPGAPTISASKSTANYGETITLNWAKASNQGNANFDHFEVNYEYPVNSGKYSNLIYNGTGTSCQVKPSDITGAKGGQVKYIIHEVHEWYKTYPFSQASVDVTVRSGVVSAYDSSGNRHTGLVTAYDSSGNSHYVLITAYDSSGNAHSVV